MHGRSHGPTTSLGNSNCVVSEPGLAPWGTAAVMTVEPCTACRRHNGGVIAVLATSQRNTTQRNAHCLAWPRSGLLPEDSRAGPIGRGGPLSGQCDIYCGITELKLHHRLPLSVLHTHTMTSDVRSHPTAKPAARTILNLGNLPPKKHGFFAAASAQRTPSRVDPNNPPWPAYRGYHEYSFAHETMGKRLPTILGKGIDDTIKTLNEQHEESKIVDLTKCIERMQDLMNALQTNQNLRPIKDDGEGDVALWNKEIAKFFRGKNFMNAPWLFAEAYKYRRLHECFSVSKYWNNYDVFFRQKCDTFSRSSTAVFELSTRFAEPFHHVPGASEEEKVKAAKLVFHELTQICLWGNATDLSLLINMTEDDIKNLQSTGGEHLAETEKNILGNDLDKLWDLVSTMKGGRIDFVLDNAGFELYCDCVYADWLIQSGIASEIHFHGKRLPWFVSDVTRKDWSWLLNSMMYGSLFPNASDAEIASLRQMAVRWKSYEQTGKWVYEQHPFWCTGYTFWSLPSEAPDLFLDLAESDLVLFKGDLNHRKLTYDCQAPSQTPFDVAIGPMSSEDEAPPVASLRTIKSDVVVGVDEQQARKLDEQEPGWRISGKYAVVLLSEGKADRKERIRAKTLQQQQQ